MLARLQDVKRRIEEARVECEVPAAWLYSCPDVVENMFGAAQTFNALFDNGFVYVQTTANAVSLLSLPFSTCFFVFES